MTLGTMLLRRQNIAGLTATAIAAKNGNGKTANVLRSATGEELPEKPPPAAPKNDWLESANTEAPKSGRGPRSRKKKK